VYLCTIALRRRDIPMQPGLPRLAILIPSTTMKSSPSIVQNSTVCCCSSLMLDAENPIRGARCPVFVGHRQRLKLHRFQRDLLCKKNVSAR
jgi:hypothetical protein